jgi:hypothetical protein
MEAASAFLQEKPPQASSLLFIFIYGFVVN